MAVRANPKAARQQSNRRLSSRARPSTATDAATTPRSGAVSRITKTRREPQFHPRKDDRREAIARSGLTPHAIALRLGVSDGSIRRWICRGCDNLQRARQMSRILDCPLDYFLWR